MYYYSLFSFLVCVFSAILITLDFRFFNKGSYTSAHILLNLLNNARKRDKM